MSPNEIDQEFKKLSDYIKFRLDKIEEIYSPPRFTDDSMFYRGIQIYWIKEFKHYKN